MALATVTPIVALTALLRAAVLTIILTTTTLRRVLARPHLVDVAEPVEPLLAEAVLNQLHQHTQRDRRPITLVREAAIEDAAAVPEEVPDYRLVGFAEVVDTGILPLTERQFMPLNRLPEEGQIQAGRPRLVGVELDATVRVPNDDA